MQAPQHVKHLRLHRTRRGRSVGSSATSSRGVGAERPARPMRWRWPPKLVQGVGCHVSRQAHGIEQLGPPRASPRATSAGVESRRLGDRLPRRLRGSSDPPGSWNTTPTSPQQADAPASFSSFGAGRRRHSPGANAGRRAKTEATDRRFPDPDFADDDELARADRKVDVGVRPARGVGRPFTPIMPPFRAAQEDHRILPAHEARLQRDNVAPQGGRRRRRIASRCGCWRRSGCSTCSAGPDSTTCPCRVAKTQVGEVRRRMLSVIVVGPVPRSRRPAQQVKDQPARRARCGRRLVRDGGVGLAPSADCDDDALALAARQLVRELARALLGIGMPTSVMRLDRALKHHVLRRVRVVAPGECPPASWWLSAVVDLEDHRRNTHPRGRRAQGVQADDDLVLATTRSIPSRSPCGRRPSLRTRSSAPDPG